MNKNRILVTGGSGFIGSYLVNKLLQEGFSEIINIDIAEPDEKKHKPFWHNIDLLDKEKVVEIFEKFQPVYVMHLAARTDTEPENVLADYKVNTEGTSNILSAIKNCPGIDKVIITSTQFVNQYNGLPKHDEDYAPHTVYG